MNRKVLLGILAAALAVFAVQAQEMTEEAIKERIKPVGSVHIAGAQAQTASAGAPRSGEDIYNQACLACHGPGVLGAPKLQDAADWQPRLDEKGFDMVVQNAINGIGGMPPMGTCGNCNNDDIKAAVEYMIEGI